ncbi:MAG: hypothetical protein WD805_02060 [Gaiellaceae bacterium]
MGARVVRVLDEYWGFRKARPRPNIEGIRGYLTAAVLLALVGLPGCALREDKELGRNEMATMVLPRDAMGGAYADLELHEESSGHVDNAKRAKENVDLEDSREALIRAGRIGGYSQAFRPSKGGTPLIEVSTTVELLRDEEMAAAYLEDQFADFERANGKKFEGVSLRKAKRFPVTGIGDEAGGVEVAIAFKKRRGYSTIVAFRRGRVVAAADLTRADHRDVRGEVQRLARVLESRVSGVLRGEELREPEPVSRAFGPDLESLTFAAKDFRGASLAHEGYLSFGDVRAFLREFDVAGRLGGSRIFYLRAMTQAFPNRRAARADQQFVGTEKGSRSVTQGFLRELFKKESYRPVGIEAHPLAWEGRDTVGVQFFFKASNGRMEGVLLSVQRGTLRGTVTVIGRASDVEPNDVLTVRKKLRARLASA